MSNETPPELSSDSSEHSAHSNMLLDVMDDIEYRRIVSLEDFEAVGRLRKRAFDKSDIYDDKFDAEVIEDIDFDPETKVFGVYYRGELASTIRVKRVTSANRISGAMEIFSTVLNPMLDQGMSFVDPGRLAVDHEFSKLVPGLNLLTARLPIIAGIHLGVDFVLWACKQEHGAFYRRYIRSTQLAGPITSPGLKTMSILLCNSRSDIADLFRRRPIFRYTQTEARNLFDDPVVKGQTISVLPTARMALKAA